jgi:hypothetical protein
MREGTNFEGNAVSGEGEAGDITTITAVSCVVLHLG